MRMCLAIPGKVTSIDRQDTLTRMGKVDFGGVLKQASLAFVPEAEVGDYVLVHAGFAISRLDESEAGEVFKYLREMQELDELEDPRGGAGPG
jgi:hydrogenase expression/formation protein HypC